MYDKWSLDVFYKGVDDPNIEKDFIRLEELIGKYRIALASAEKRNVRTSLHEIMDIKEQMSDVTNRLYVYFRLRRSANNTDKEGAPYRTRIQELMTSTAKDDVVFKRFVGGISNLEGVIKGDPLLEEYGFYLNDIKKELNHSLSEEGEQVFSQMNMSGGSGWSEQYSYLLSHTYGEVLGEKKTMTALQGMIKSMDKAARKKAYEAQLEAYSSIEVPLAFSINNIKAQVIEEAKLRGYDSPLDMTLDRNKMKRETLDIMWETVKESFPKFREYLKRKAKMLGYENGLPWYEIYSPVGSSSPKEYTPEDARRHLVDRFALFSPDMSEMMDRAFEEEWIDFYPRTGKSGGAFCYNLTWFGEARILTNFNGNFGAVNTLVHELGHAFHGQQTKKNRPLNRLNPLPVAETASNFNELFLLNDAISNAEGQERLALIDKQITDTMMILPEMYTRFKVEDEIFNRRQKGFVYAEEIKQIMTDAQKEAFGDGLDENQLFPYVWCDKSHFYSSQRSYYNFPYSFGSLFARGLHALYEKEGEAFVEKYRRVLQQTPVNTVEGAALMAGIDLSDRSFWKNSIQTVYDSIDLFLKETE